MGNLPSSVRGSPLLPKPVLIYPNDAYMLVFNRFTLQERLCLRIICHRWKEVIESDCSRMLSLRVFDGIGHRVTYIERTCQSGNPRMDATPWNSLTLRRPSRNLGVDDLSFLGTIFPAVENLALTWRFEHSADAADSEPDISRLLAHWAPNLRHLYLVVHRYKFPKNCWYLKTYIESNRSARFWYPLSLMQDTLKSLQLEGLRLCEAPHWILLSELKELSTFPPAGERSQMIDWLTPLASWRLTRMAPRLTSNRVPPTHDYIWDWTVPQTVHSLAFRLGCHWNELPSTLTVSPSITSLEIDCTPVRENKFIDIFFSAIPAKFPSVNSLLISEPQDGSFLCWLINKYPDSYSPWENILELTLRLSVNWNKELLGEDNGDGGLFYTLKGVFPRLRKLTLTIRPASESVHQAWYRKFTQYQRRYLPEVALSFSRFVDVEEKKAAFGYAKGQPTVGAPKCNYCCYLAPGCPFNPL